MNKIILSSGITGIDWSQSINVLVAASSKMSHVDNVMLNTKGKYDDLVYEKTEINVDHKKLKPQFKGFLTRLLKKEKSQICFLSDPVFLDSGAAWQALNSDKTFAFFFCSPEYYVAKMKDATGDGDNIDPQEHLNNWLEAASKIWAFYVRYPDVTVLINIEDVARDPRSNACKVFEFLGGELDDADSKQVTPIAAAMVNPLEALASLLLQNMQLETIKASGELNELYENLAVTSILAENELSYDASERAGIRLSECHKLIAHLSTCQARLESESASISAKNAELMADNEQLVGWRSDFEAQNAKLTTLNNQAETRIEQLVTQHSQLQEELAAAHLNAKALKAESTAHTLTLETSVLERTAENELALLQIHQLQEELEATYLKANQVEGELAASASARKTELAERKSENELALLQIKQLQQELEASYLNANVLNDESVANTSALENQLSERKSENELALLQINQLQEELEASYLNANVLNDESVAHTSALENQLSERKSENELALLQINQLQEELEHYYIQYQKMTYSPQSNIGYRTNLNRVKHSLSLMNMN
jgi:hypothetical protein